MQAIPKKPSYRQTYHTTKMRDSEHMSRFLYLNAESHSRELDLPNHRITTMPVLSNSAVKYKCFIQWIKHTHCGK
jgi:hypothetical protein